jgi:acetyltransferase
VVPVFSAKTQAKVREMLSAAPQILAANNPVDVGDIPFESPEVFSRCCSACLEDPEIDMALIAGLFGGYGSGQIVLSKETKRREEATAHEIVGLTEQFGKPVVVHTIYAKDPVLALQVLRDGGIPVCDSVEKAVRLLASLSLSGELRQKAVQERLELSMRQRPSEVDEIFRRARPEGRAGLLETEVRELVEQYGIPVCAGDFAKTQNEAIEVARRIGYPVVMKVISPVIIHKTDADCVKLNLRTDDEVALAYDAILRSARKFNGRADVRGVLVTSFAREGTEIIVGVTRDPKFGALVMFGLGGIFVELLKDVTFRSIPMSREDAVQMIEGIRGRPILDGGRRRPRCDHEAILDVLMAVSRLAEECPEIVELDLNPIRVFEKGLMALDARAKLG